MQQTKDQIYDQIYQEAIQKGWQAWGGNERLKTAKDWLAQLLSYSEIPNTGKALELGCGEGNLCRLLAKQGYEITGMDVSQVAIDWAKRKSKVNGINEIVFLQKDLSATNALQNEAGQFDVVADGNCLHCIIGEDRKVFFQNVHNALKTEGVFFISSLCSKGGVTEYIDRENQIYRHIPSPKALKQELEEAGFQVVKTTVFTRTKYNHICIHALKQEMNRGENEERNIS
ncbi:MAG: class I SAM-dependent methyltransferase [Chitinophagales bacterium]